MRKLSHRFVLPLALIAGALSLGLVRSDSSRALAANPRQQPTRVETYLPQEAPLTFHHAFSSKENGRTLLSYSFAAQSRLDSVQLVALLLDSSGELKGGQGWTMSVSAAPGETVEGSIDLQGDVRPTDHVMLTVWKANGNSTVFARGFARTLKAYRQAKGLTGSLPSALQFVNAAGQEIKNTCSASLTEAKEACGCGGIKSFSCHPATGQYSFECFPKNGCDGSGPKPATEQSAS